MPLGPALRSVMTSAMERRLSGMYRRIFVDLEKVSLVLLPYLPHGARILDIGGGDGELLNHLLGARPDLTIDMVDIAPSVGKFIHPRHASKVGKFVRTPVEDLPAENSGYDVALISDVIHHLPADYREEFLLSVRDRLGERACLLIKDIEPGNAIANLSLFCDIYVSGDNGVSLVSLEELKSLCARLGSLSMAEIGLLEVDRPNYALRVVFGSSGNPD